MSASIRPALACIKCRSSKVKCEGQIPVALLFVDDSSSSRADSAELPADITCSRCERLGLQCLWRPCHRAGRPLGRKRRRSEEAKTPQTLENTNVNTGKATSTKQVDKSSPGSVESHGASAHPSSSSLTTETIEENSLAHALQGQSFDELFGQLLSQDSGMYTPVDITTRNPGAQDLINSAKVATTDPSATHDSISEDDAQDERTPEMDIIALRNRVRRPVYTSSATLENTAVGLIGTLDLRKDDDLAERGVLLFWKGLSSAIPLFGKLDELNEALQCSGCDSIDLKSIDLLLSAISTLGYALFEGRESQSFLKMRRASLEALEDIRKPDLSTAAKDSLVRCTAGTILVCYATFGCGEASDLSGQKRTAIAFAEAARLSSMDRDTPAPLETSTFSWITPQFRNLARRAFWELRIIDSVFDVATSGQVKRSFVTDDKNIELPTSDPDLRVDVRGTWDLRRRTARLLFDCVHSRLLHESAPGLSLMSADALCANTIAEAELAFLKLTRPNRHLQRQHCDRESVVRQCQTVVFDCLIMLHVSRLHLHRVTWFADISMGMRSCGFKRSEDKSSSSLIEKSFGNGQTWLDARLESMEKISKSATSILSLLQMDTDAFFKRNLAHVGVANMVVPLIPVHWPIIGCCQMAASYGLFVNLVSQDDGVEKETCQTQLSGQGASQSVSLTLSIHRKQEFLSGIKLTAILLEQMSEVWQISAQYLNQIEQCRKTVISDDTLAIGR